MTSCNDAQRDFSAYWEEELSALRRERLESHWTACKHCRAEYENFAAAMRAVRSLPRLSAPEGLAASVLVRVREIEVSRPAGWWSPARLFDWQAWRADWGWRPAIAAATAVLAVVAGVAVVQQGFFGAPGEIPSGPQVASEAPVVPPSAEPIPLAEVSPEPAGASVPDRALASAPAQEPPAEAEREPSPASALRSERLAGAASPGAGSGTASSFLDSLLQHGAEVEYALDRIRLRSVPGDSSLTPMPAMPGAPEGKPASLTF